MIIMDKVTPVYVVVTAGGRGSRMGSALAKQFLELGGVPILHKTLQFFLKQDFRKEIILVLPADYKEYWKKYCLDNSVSFSHRLVSGGITRFHSVKNALQFVPDGVKVLVHDGVRPFVTQPLLSRLLEFDMEGSGCYGVIPVLPATDSMRRKREDGSTVIVRREDYVFVQTPQLFCSSRLKEAYRQAYSPSFTDDASVFESAGYRVATVEGSRLNIKITTPEDLKTGAAIDSLAI